MAFQQGLSGLAVSSKALDVTSNNIANSATVGFKQAQTHFSDMYASALGGGAQAAQAGIGASVAAIFQQFSQGNITATNNPLDVAINGSGFFGMDQGGAKTYTRNGQFHLDKDGYIVNDKGLNLTGTLADPVTDTIPNVVPGGDLLKVDFAMGKAKATTTIDMTANLDARATTPVDGVFGAVTGTAIASFPVTINAANQTMNVRVDGGAATALTLTAGTYASAAALATEINTRLAAASLNAVASSSGNTLKLETRTLGTGGSMQLLAGTANTPLGLPAAAGPNSGIAFDINNADTYTSSTGATVYDSQGSPHTLTYYFVKTPVPGVWNMFTAMDGTTAAGSTSLTFGSNGQLTSPASPISLGPYTLGASVPGGSVPSPITVSLGISNLTQFSSNYAVNRLTQDGYAPGNLVGVSVDKSGIVKARYDNGQSRDIGLVALYACNNPNGLQNAGNNQWVETGDSGQLTAGRPNTGIFGVLQSSATEDSNVDMTVELVNMIVHQRNYQANAQSIKTQDQILQTLINLR